MSCFLAIIELISNFEKLYTDREITRIKEEKT